MVLMHRVFFVCLLIFVASASSLATDSKGPPQAKVFASIRVLYKDAKNQENQYLKRDEIHSKLGTRLLYRAKNLPVEELLPPDGVTGPSPALFLRLNRLCNAYLNDSIVRACEVVHADALDEQELHPEIQKFFNAWKKPYQFIDSLNGLRTQNKKDICGLVETHEIPLQVQGLSPFWAQELVGADLLRESFPEESQTIRVANIDGGHEREFILGPIDEEHTNLETPESKAAAFKDHGTKVVNLINGPLPYGVGRNAVLDPLENAYTGGSFVVAADRVLASKPDFVNLELHTHCVWKSGSGMGEVGIVRELISKLSQTSILVAASGNNFPGCSSEENPFGDLRLIVVGSMAPNGWISDFSDESEGVSIVAPSDSYQTSYGVNGSHGFGGTSGATPLVTGALSNVASMLPGITVEEIIQVLEKTAVKLAFNRAQPIKNGLGMVNAYRLLEVAKRLAPEWPENRDRLNTDESLFQFEFEADELQDQADELMASEDCEDQKQGFKMLRTAFLLDQDSESREELARIYREIGYPHNASFFEQLDTEVARSRVRETIGPPPSPGNPPSLRSARRMEEMLR